ncbi:diguanylate cyclase domain-containing protein [Clostridium sp. Cult2]|uniref:diguanylate cyclase domain-containing protein n=1 Tax=Clostridium sp. Cult2 TaxID=2079003 RepID=UPI001F3DC9A9|nr:diguanylate cyclase [Clostridium sp. Cult2]MCF6466709.1 hypothetical protein [Clostridium sp. Cult2]
MKLIDNRYKVNKVLEDNIYNSIYEVVDFWNDDERLFMKLYNIDKQNRVIDYFINNFVNLTRIKHKHLLSSEQFSIIKTIDRKKVNIIQYYATTEFIDSPSLDKVHDYLNLEEKLRIILQACTVLDFLHYRGLVYRHLSPSNIFLLEDGNIKIMDLANISENIINASYADLTRYFIAPEVLLDRKDMINKNADKYSLGMLIIYLLTKDFYSDNITYQYKDDLQMNDRQINFLTDTINSLTKKNSIAREISLREVINRIKEIFNLDYEYDLVKERGTLNFKTQIVGRDKEIDKILSTDEDLMNEKDFKKAILISGDTGVGKTRLLKEITYLLKMRGREVYYLEITQNIQSGLKPATNILRQTVKDAPINLLNKYSKELIKVLPELKFVVNIEPIDDIRGDRERLRLYDRVTNFLEEFTKDKPMYLIIDNLGDCSEEFLHLLDYLMDNINKESLVLVAAINEKKILKKSSKDNIFQKWFSEQNIENIKVSNLNLSEIGEFIQYILGMSYKPLKFAAVMLKESGGNPRYIEYMMKDLYAKGELFLHPDGYWEIKTQKYSDIYFPSSIDEAMKNQISLIEKQYMDIMEIVSVYNDSMSKTILFEMLDIDNDDINAQLNDLVVMGLLDEKVADWGFSYSVSNFQLKKLIYHRIPIEERIKLHNKLAKLLEENYGTNYKIMMEELIYHLMASDQTEKALNYIIKEAREETNILSTQSILLWEEAYEIVKDVESEYRLEVLKSLGNIYFLKGENDRALNRFKELYDVCKNQEELKYMVIANIGIGEIYLKRNLTEKAINKAQESIKLSKELNYLPGIAKSNILYSKILLNDGKLQESEKDIKKLLDFVLKNNLHEELGDVYNLMGILEYYSGNIEVAIERYSESIKHFHQVGEFINSTKPINNIANIYSQRGEYDKAMDYYEEGLKIVEKYGLLNLKLVFLNNIGEVYMDICDYDKAKTYIEEARALAMEVKDTNLIFLSNINLGLIYLLTGDYELSYNCYIMLKEGYINNPNFNFEVISQYNNFLGEFYYAFGKWDEALKYSLKAMKLCKEYNNTGYLMSKTRVILIQYLKDGSYNKVGMEDIRAEFRNINLEFIRRTNLLQLGIIALLEGDYEYVADILKEDNELKKDYSAPSLEYIRKILLYSITKDKNRYKDMIILEEGMKKHNLLHLDIFANILIGNNLVTDGKYYQAINYLLETLDLIYRTIKNVPQRDFQVSFIKSRKTDRIKIKLMEVIYKIFNKRLDYTCIDDIKPEDSIENYFDYNSIFSLIDDSQFTRITEINYLYEETKGIFNIEDLIKNLTNDYKYNLKLILKYISKETFAQRGYILIYDEESNRYMPIVSLDEDLDWKPNENLLALANRYEKGILISSSLGSNVIGLHKEFLPKDTRALICIPIIAPSTDTCSPKEERRKVQVQYNQKNEGYIYLETGRIFNRFDEERQRLASTLTKILYINIENYKLKILSNIDKLTGTYTRKYFETEFNRTLIEAKRKDESFAVMMMDLDRFKNINDTYGHRKGDEVLEQIGTTLLSSIRNTDIVARYGGEEFIIVLKNIEENEAKKIGEKVRLNIQNLKITNIENPITISVGISMFPNHSQFKEELIEKADQALYCAKEKGRNMVVLWNTDLANTLNRVDRLAGILSGNTNMNQRNILAILDIIDIAKQDMEDKEKIFAFLGRVIETLEAENCAFIEIERGYELSNIYARSRLNINWIEPNFINQNIVDKVIMTGKGEFLIDWESANEINLLLNTPDWQSVIAIPLVFKGQTKGIVYITVPIKEKEFDYNTYNLTKVLCDIFSTVV